MEKEFNVFSGIDSKENMIKMYNERRQGACENMVYQIEFLEKKLKDMKETLVKCKHVQPGEYVNDMVGNTKYVQSQADTIAEFAYEINKCEAVIGALL